MKILLFILLFNFDTWAFPRHCLKDFKKLTPRELQSVTPEFLKTHHSRYSVEIDSTSVSNQCAYGSCWIHARLSHIEENIKKKTGKEIKLSRHYLIVQSLLDRIDAALENPRSIVIQTGTENYADELIERYGLVPDDPSAWSPRVPFDEAPHAGRLIYFLNARAAQFHEKAEKLKRESEAYLDLRDQARKKMRQILKAYSGPPPRKFKVQDTLYTPKLFANSLAKNFAPNPLWVYPSESPVALAATPPRINATRESLVKMENRIIDALRSGQSVTLRFENNPLFIDKETGIMSLEAFNTPAGFMPASRVYRSNFQKSSSYHSVDVVGADLDPNGRLIKLKIKNSWGTQVGEGGYFHMYRDYFEHFVSFIYLSDAGAPGPER